MRFVIVSKDRPGWAVRLGHCTYRHAESVVAQLEADLSAPNQLRLKRVFSLRKQNV